MKAGSDRALSIGWYAAVFAAQKRLKPLGEYLKPEPKAQDKRAQGAADVAAMLRRRAKKTEQSPSK